MQGYPPLTMTDLANYLEIIDRVVATVVDGGEGHSLDSGCL
jgi:hypothetical protein